MKVSLINGDTCNRVFLQYVINTFLNTSSTTGQSAAHLSIISSSLTEGALIKETRHRGVCLVDEITCVMSALRAMWCKAAAKEARFYSVFIFCSIISESTSCCGWMDEEEKQLLHWSPQKTAVSPTLSPNNGMVDAASSHVSCHSTPKLRPLNWMCVGHYL